MTHAVTPGSQDEALKLDIKRLIVSAVERDIAPEEIGDEDVLIGEDSRWTFDSLDALQIAVAIGKRYGARIRDSKHARVVMRTVNALADFIQPGT